MSHPLLTKWLADILQPDAHALLPRVLVAAEAIAKDPAIADVLEAALDVCQYVYPDGDLCGQARVWHEWQGVTPITRHSYVPLVQP